MASAFQAEVHLSTVRGMQFSFAAYVLSGGLVIVGAVTSLKPTLAAIVAFAALCWMWLWMYFLWQSRSWIEPESPSSRGASQA